MLSSDSQAALYRFMPVEIARGDKFPLHLPASGPVGSRLLWSAGREPLGRLSRHILEVFLPTSERRRHAWQTPPRGPLRLLSGAAGRVPQAQYGAPHMMNMQQQQPQQSGQPGQLPGPPGCAPSPGFGTLCIPGLHNVVSRCILPVADLSRTSKHPSNLTNLNIEYSLIELSIY